MRINIGCFVDGGEGGILLDHPKKFSAVMVKRKSFEINEQFLEKPFYQCH
jgi:hypothetical protein